VPPTVQANRTTSVSPSVATEVALIVSEGGCASYAAAIASRPWYGPAGTPAKLITASSVKHAVRWTRAPRRVESVRR
jgi:hypothetical protein